MAVYKVNKDGKAPSGLKAGDSVVTGGGTYKITGVNADGSYKSTKENNTTTSTYTGSYSNSSTGTSSGSTSYKGSTTSGGGTSNKTYSTGTQTNNNSWSADVDYSKLMSDAVAKGDYKAAARYEQLRNQKINATGSQYATSNKYQGWLDPTDYSALGTQQMAQGVDAATILKTINDRYNKSASTEGLQQYANDELQQAMWQYYQKALASEANQNAQDYIDNFQFDQEKPIYESQYNSAIDTMLNDILNREDFSYDAQKDPLYQQYAAMYQREGDRAMRDTLAEAAASAGGMNSYAITAAQQANDYYNSQLGDKIPELYQLAYQMYLQDKESMVQDLGLLQGMDDRQYNRYRDTMSDFYNDKNFAYGMYADAVQQGNWQQNFDYNAAVNDRNFNYNSAQDAITNGWKGKEWDNKINQQELENSRYNDTLAREDSLLAKEEAQQKAYALLELGQMPSSELLQAAGLDEAFASAYLKGIKEQQTAKSSGGGGSSSSSSKKKYTGDDDDDDDDDYIVDDSVNDTPVVSNVTEHPNYNNGTVAGLGIGMINDETLAKLALVGAVETDDDGRTYWADGWNANNYQERLKAMGPFPDLLTAPLFN